MTLLKKMLSVTVGCVIDDITQTSSSITDGYVVDYITQKNVYQLLPVVLSMALIKMFVS
jgi:hypothetical protein